MKALIALALIPFVHPSLAAAQDCTIRIWGRGMANFWHGKHDAKVARILQSKGHTVVDDHSAT